MNSSKQSLSKDFSTPYTLLLEISIHEIQLSLQKHLQTSSNYSRKREIYIYFFFSKSPADNLQNKKA
jgi:hypothetical protein